ncbi:transglycosylase SLT domain-containing protein [Methylomonas sp. LL1]|uniref:transglycosylase SLT domain-containing protein n=1 Tax=Methylomonas sp. LL1 TaxID=2785785 RepID=UPI0018C3BF61|nr:transglycosylase SLT domain-containing protein [Methylomonas sp. LL1]QPK62789.1 transglycosylase SLT domain-containing protein [Methylomonas sp. LL1]
MKIKFLILASLAILSACATLPPKNSNNICQIFLEKDDWYQATLAASRRWGVPIAVQMSIIQQESSFVNDAEPPRPTILGFIPWFRSSSAYGYPQAQDGTWSDYQRQTGNNWADREDFADSCDFVAWYCAISHQKLGIPTSDARNLYLAYHEGHNGYRRQNHQNKRWLLNTAQKVDQRAWMYDAQLATCRQELESEN